MFLKLIGEIVINVFMIHRSYRYTEDIHVCILKKQIYFCNAAWVGS
jgi:hypothetical protein